MTHGSAVSLETAATPIAMHIATSATAYVNRFIAKLPVDVTSCSFRKTPAASSTENNLPTPRRE
jgi:hypothetical protein